MAELNILCQCPTCKFCRKEISSSEYAWYLKGKIEAYANAKKAQSIECNIDACRLDYDTCKCYLEDLLQDPKKRPKLMHSAWFYPEQFIPDPDAEKAI